jgi:thioesterase domain-containing protein
MTKVEEHVPLHVGDALPNVDFLVLGESGQPVPQGTVGELCIVSDALADGYVNRPEETASCFLPRERDGKAHWDQRLYRTGDFMRHDGHGVLAFLGRRDDQVKIRGFRVELTEIEHVIEAEPDVDQAVVIRNPHAAAHDALVAFVRPDRPPSALKAIEAKLSDRLPDYMVPRQWIGLNSMPMTTNGKLDRKTLVSIIPTRIGESDATEPRFPLEASILSEWTSHLGTEQIGVHDDFFQVGGNSITAVGLAKALTRGLGRSVTVGDIFRAPTVAAMAVALTAKSSVHAKETTLIPLNRIDDAKAKEPLFLIHPQGGGIACYHDLARCLDGKIAVYGIQAIGFADPSRAPLGSIDEMSERYVHDIQALDPPAGQVHLAGWSFGGAIAVEVARVLSEHGMEVGFVGLFDAAPFQPRQDRTAPVSELFVKRWFASVYLEEDPIDDFELDHEAIDHRLVLGLRDKGMIGPGAEGQEQLNHLVNYMRHNIEVARTYQFRRPIASDLWLFRVSELPLKEKRALVEPLAWSRFTTGEIRTIPVPGHHHTMLASDNAEPLARELWNCLRWSKEQNASKRNQHRSAEMEIYR